MKRKYNHPTFNHSHWIFYWDIVFGREILESHMKDLYYAMKKDLYETEYTNLKYDQYKK